MSTQLSPRLSAQEYLTKERAADFKSEFYRGEMFAMAGASRRHNLIVGNLLGETREALKSRPCEVYPSDMRVQISATGLYTYPDISIVCGEKEFEDEHFDTLLNPTLLIEVLSKITEGYDRGTKTAHYRRLSSVKEYVLVAQDRVSVECCVRQPDGHWALRDAIELSDSVKLASLDVEIPMSEIYRNVDFTEDVRYQPSF